MSHLTESNQDRYFRSLFLGNEAGASIPIMLCLIAVVGILSAVFMNFMNDGLQVTKLISELSHKRTIRHYIGQNMACLQTYVANQNCPISPPAAAIIKGYDNADIVASAGTSFSLPSGALFQIRARCTQAADAKSSTFSFEIKTGSSNWKAMTEAPIICPHSQYKSQIDSGISNPE